MTRQSIQFRYEYLKSLRRVGWQVGAGAALKLPDNNRRLKLKSDSCRQTDENLQRVFAEFSLAWTPDPDILWRLHLLPKVLFNWSGEQTGHETEVGISMGLKVWEFHRIRVTGTMLYGEVGGCNLHRIRHPRRIRVPALGPPGFG